MTTKINAVKRTTSLAMLAGVAATVLLAATALTVAPGPAQAHPAYAQKTGMVCGACHVNTKGGGTLNAYGSKWVTGGMKAAKPKK